jgi:NitT/TauT family transport system permease protein
MEAIERMKKQAQTFSAEHLLYLKRQSRSRRLVTIARIALLALLLGTWELLADREVVNPFITSSPSRIAKTIASLYADGTLFYHIGVTLGETLAGFCIAVAGGYLIALLLWWSEPLRKILEPYLVVLNALPKIALGPLIIIWCGTGAKAIVVITVLIGIIISIMNMLGGFAETDKDKMLLLRSMGATKGQILLKLVIPSSLPAFISMLKINVGMAWIGSIMGEYIVSKAGLGYLIVYGGQVFKLDLVMAATVILCFLAGVMYFMVALLEKIVVKNYDR